MASGDWPFTNAWSLHGNKSIVSRYEILERIGEGTFGEVHRARRREDNLIVALKEIHDVTSSEREIKALHRLNHANVVKLHESFTQGSNMVLVLEYLPHSLAEVIRAGKGKLSDADVKGWMIQILRGLAACHEASILHRDLKPHNLLISEDGNLKIADFGQARILSEGEFENEGLSETEILHNYATGSEAQSVHASAMRDNQELEFRGDVSVLEGRTGGDNFVEVGGVPLRTSKAQPTDQCVCVGCSKSMGKGNVLKASVESFLLAGDFPTVPRGTDTFQGYGTRLGSGPTNLGFSALADVVKDTRNYITVEEMGRSGTGIKELELSALQKQQVIPPESTVDPGCYGKPMENVENHPALTGVRSRSSGNEITWKGNVVSVERDQARGLEADFSSESDVFLKRKCEMNRRDVIDILTREELHKSVPSSSPSKGNGDFQQKLRRFIKKRKLRPSDDGKKARPNYLRMARRGVNSLKERAQRDRHAPQVLRSLGPRKLVSTVNVQDIPPAPHNLRTATTTENMICLQGEQVGSEVQIKEGSRSFHTKERKSLQAASTNDLGEGPPVAGGACRLDHMHEVSVVSGFKVEDCAKQWLVGDGSTVLEKCKEEFMDGEEDGGDLRIQSGRKLYGGLKVEQLERKTRVEVVVSGQSREMAYARVHEVGDTGAIGQLEFKDNLRVDETDHVKTGGAQMQLMNWKKSNRDKATTVKGNMDEEDGNDSSWAHQEALKSPNTHTQEALRTKKCENLRTWEMGAKNVDTVEETCDGTSEGISVEPILNGDICKSWTEMKGSQSTLSDLEGTTWYGAPEFQYSYADSKIAASGGGKVLGRTHGDPTASEEESEKEGSENRADHNGGAHSQESTERDKSELEDFSTMVGTRWYKAPELLYGATKYGMGVDLWAVGCIFGELLWGKPVFPGLNDIDQLSRIVRILGSPNEAVWRGVSLLPDFNKISFVDDRSPLCLRKYLPQISEAALEFLQTLLTYDPVLRPTAEIALQDEFFLKSPLPSLCHELQLPTGDESEASDEEWGNWKDPGSAFSDLESLG